MTLKKGSKVSLGGIAYLYLRSGNPETGYVVVPRKVPEGRHHRGRRAGKQSSAPLPGPTLVARLADGDRSFSTLELDVRIGIASSASQAKSVAKSLGA